MTTSSDGYITATADLTTSSVLLSINVSAGIPGPAVNLATLPNGETGAVALATLANSTLLAVNGQAGVGTGTWVTRQQVTGAGTSTARTVESFACSPGSWYTGSYSNKSLVTARNVQLAIAWYTAAGTYISTSTIGTAVTGSTAAYVRPFVSAQAPATAYLAKLEVTVVGGSAGNQSYWDGIQFERARSASTSSAPSAYVDGNAADSRWIGAANASQSYRPAYQWATVTRYASSPDGVTVRGADAVLAPGGQHPKLIDHEAVPGILTSYQVSITNGLSTIYSTLATATITGQDAVTWLKSLRTPALSDPLTVLSAPDWQSDIPLGVLYPLTSSYGIASSGVRRSRTGSMTVLTATRAELDSLEALLASDGPYLLAMATNSGEPARYVMVGQVSVDWVVSVAGTQERVVTLALIEVARPSTTGSRVSYPGHTYADSRVTWPLYSNRTGTYGSR